MKMLVYIITFLFLLSACGMNDLVDQEALLVEVEAPVVEVVIPDPEESVGNGEENNEKNEEPEEQTQEPEEKESEENNDTEEPVVEDDPVIVEEEPEVIEEGQEVIAVTDFDSFTLTEYAPTNSLECHVTVTYDANYLNWVPINCIMYSVVEIEVVHDRVGNRVYHGGMYVHPGRPSFSGWFMRPDPGEVWNIFNMGTGDLIAKVENF